MHALRDAHAAVLEGALSFDTSMSTTMGLLQEGVTVKPPGDLPVRSSIDCLLLLPPAPGSCHFSVAVEVSPLLTACQSTTRAPLPSWQCPQMCSIGLARSKTVANVGQPPSVQCWLSSRYPAGGVWVTRTSRADGMSLQIMLASPSEYWNAQFCCPRLGEYGEPNTRRLTPFSGR